MKIEDISIWQAFAMVGKLSSFSQAAQALRQTPSQISKRVSKLEESLQTQLFYRSTRSVRLTKEGESLLPKIDSLLEDLIGIEQTFGDKGQVTGTVRLTAVPYVAHRLMPEVLKECERHYPGLKIEMELTKKFTNIIESRFDMAIRIETPKDSDLVYIKLAPNTLSIAATPQYLKSNPVNKVKDLVDCEILSLRIHDRSEFTKTGQKLGEYTRNKRVSCDNGVFLTNLALQSQGVVVRSKWALEPYLKTGELVEVLTNQPLKKFGDIYAVIPSKRYLAPRVRALLEIVKDVSAKWR